MAPDAPPPPTVSLASFNDYKRAVLEIAGDLKQLREYTAELKMERAVSLIDDVLRRIEENCFSIAIVGEFKRGKSTLINALLGKDILPSDIMPCSATLNRVTYGLKPGVTITFHDGHTEQIEIDRLADYVTKLTPESEQIASTIKDATVQYPIPYCQNNVEIIDTPGLNDDESMTAVTLGVLPEVDAAILVIMAQAPFSEFERDFLENKLLTNDLGRVLFVVTALDRLNRPEDAERVLASIRGRIQKHVMDRAAEQFGADSEEYESYIRKIGTPKVFGLSAFQALEAKATNNMELMARSRFGEFEAALEKFLSEDRGAVFLQVPVNRMLAATKEILSAISIREGALKMKGEEFAKVHQKSISDLDILREKQQKELKKIDAAAERVEAQVQPLVDGLDTVMKEAAGQVIDEALIKPADLGNAASTQRITKQLGEEVLRAAQGASQKQTEKVQHLIQKGLALEADRLKEFSDAVESTLRGVEMQFTGPETTGSPARGSGEAITAAMSVFTGLGGIWSGYRVAGVKGAATGGAASFATALGVGVIAAVIGAPVTLPLLVATGVVSIFTGGWATRAIFAKETVVKFKESYKKAVFEQIDRQILALGTEQKVQSHINQTFAALKRKIQQEVDATLDDTQNTLSEMRMQKHRDETLTQTEADRLTKMRDETRRIQQHADALGDQVVKIMAA